MSDEEENILEIELEPEEEPAPPDAEKPTETLWQRYLREVPLEESRRYQACEFARMAFECPSDKFVELAAAIDAFLRDGRQVEAKKLKAVKND
jgi:hypothetical protein